MLASVLALSTAYVFMTVLLLIMAIKAPLNWRWKFFVIILASFFFVHNFFETRALLGWPGIGRLPERFQLLWVRVVEPDQRMAESGAIYLWIEEVDENNVPVGVPRSFQLPYRRGLAAQSLEARDQILKGDPQEGKATHFEQGEKQSENSGAGDQDLSYKDRQGAEMAGRDVSQRVDLDAVQQAQQVIEFRRMPSVLLPVKRP